MMRHLAAGLVGLLAALVGCRHVPTDPADALVALIAAAAAGEHPDPHGWVDPTDPARAAAFLHVEKWVNVNAEAVTAVRAAELPAEAGHLFTRTTDGRVTYVIVMGWPGKQMRTKSLQPAAGTRVTILGWPDALRWEQVGAVCVVETPRELADDANHPCEQAFVFRFEAAR